ncbi:hypothetical protein B0O99DRAFT_51756 [Bisporella sp. PMI_857]|nr:hypothetical protein B0O99DRAFT_51756 [Bisporella sp. PMI_857]
MLYHPIPYVTKSTDPPPLFFQVHLSHRGFFVSMLLRRSRTILSISYYRYLLTYLPTTVPHIFLLVLIPDCRAFHFHPSIHPPHVSRVEVPFPPQPTFPLLLAVLSVLHSRSFHFLLHHHSVPHSAAFCLFSLSSFILRL